MEEILKISTSNVIGSEIPKSSYDLVFWKFSLCKMLNLSVEKWEHTDGLQLDSVLPKECLIFASSFLGNDVLDSRTFIFVTDVCIHI